MSTVQYYKINKFGELSKYQPNNEVLFFQNVAPSGVIFDRNFNRLVKFGVDYQEARIDSNTCVVKIASDKNYDNCLMYNAHPFDISPRNVYLVLEDGNVVNLTAMECSPYEIFLGKHILCIVDADGKSSLYKSNDFPKRKILICDKDMDINEKNLKSTIFCIELFEDEIKTKLKNVVDINKLTSINIENYAKKDEGLIDETERQYPIASDDKAQIFYTYDDILEGGL